MRGFEPPTLRSRTVRATRLRYIPTVETYADICYPPLIVNGFFNILSQSRNSRFCSETRPPQRNSVASHRAGTKVFPAGVAALRRGQKPAENAVSGQKMPFLVRQKDLPAISSPPCPVLPRRF
jgi:hypothetical protein